MNITKSLDLVKEVGIKTNLTQAQVKSVFEAYAEIVGAMDAKDEKIILPGLGNFNVVLKEARKGRNPITGESVDIPERLAYKFKFTGIKNKFKE